MRQIVDKYITRIDTERKKLSIRVSMELNRDSTEIRAIMDVAETISSSSDKNTTKTRNSKSEIRGKAPSSPLNRPRLAKNKKSRSFTQTPEKEEVESISPSRRMEIEHDSGMFYCRVISLRVCAWRAESETESWLINGVMFSSLLHSRARAEEK